MDWQIVAFVGVVILAVLALRWLRGLSRDRRPTAIYVLEERQWFGWRVCYVGQTLDPQKRYRQHERGNSTPVDRHMKQAHLEMRVVKWVPRWRADDEELALIARYSRNHLYNVEGKRAPGGRTGARRRARGRS